MTKSYRVLGIDPGTATVGWAVLEVNGPVFSPLGYGHISTKPDVPMSQRLVEIATDVEHLIKTYAPDEASIENIFFFKNQKTIVSVSQARGVLIYTMARLGLSVHEYTPLQVKQAVTGYGRADKKQMQEMVRVVLKLKSIPKPDDAADALAIALCHTQSRSIGLLQKTHNRGQ